ncbi:MAG: D-lyxose/D-mannose family sugar isomerase [Sedimentisphaerales bacterium]|nr:D-lyxose/D-mannose family sugar isomerase [Sedimentisphaerales bacterium]
MKRSEINQQIVNAKELLKKYSIILPPFAYWSPDDWKSKGRECDEIRDCMLGWDITDFGSDQFDKIGLVVFTVRNGHPTMKEYGLKTYCEKIIIMKPNQHCPMHFHWNKTEDIINRCGGNLVFKMHNMTKDEKLADTPVTVSLDGVKKTFAAGEEVVLKPGESMTVPAYLYHEFWAQEGKGMLVAGEVSKVNDDNTDNRFLMPAGRFPEVEEDCPPVHYLCTEYPTAR